MPASGADPADQVLAGLWLALLAPAMWYRGLCQPELELELIQTHMAQKPLLWIEVGAHAVRNTNQGDKRSTNEL
jgi:hypothetical protein